MILTITEHQIAFSASFMIPVNPMILMMSLCEIFILALWAEPSIGGRIYLLDLEMH
jgi:hypothetical protein